MNILLKILILIVPLLIFISFDKKLKLSELFHKRYLKNSRLRTRGYYLLALLVTFILFFLEDSYPLGPSFLLLCIYIGTKVQK